jgi:hypothetical protein
VIIGASALRAVGAMADRCGLSCPDTDDHYKTTGHGLHLDGKFLSYSFHIPDVLMWSPEFLLPRWMETYLSA